MCIFLKEALDCNARSRNNAVFMDTTTIRPTPSAASAEAVHHAPLKTGLLLLGGGARAAYQVGVLSAISEMRQTGAHATHENPFRVIAGTSAGAINAVSLACGATHFHESVAHLRAVWENFKPHQVYRSDWLGVLSNTTKWFAAVMFGAFIKKRLRVSLFDNSPLTGLLEQALDFKKLAHSLEQNALDAVAVTASGYASGQNCSFFQAQPHIEGWKRAQRVGIRCKLDVEHLLASSAIPFIFPAVKLNREFFGDGSMRQNAPLSAPLHLGASRILIIPTARVKPPDPGRVIGNNYPSLAEIAGHAMRSIFLDNLSLDIELLERLNDTLSLIEHDKRAAGGLTLKQVEVLVIAPSVPLDELAVEYTKNLPLPIRFLMRFIGAMRKGGAHLASYLLFEEAYCKRIVALGYADAMNRRDEIESFLRGDSCTVPGAHLRTAKFFARPDLVSPKAEVDEDSLPNVSGWSVDR